MRILFVAPYLPSPPRSGGQRRLEGLIRGLAARHEVSLLCFAQSDPAETQSYCRELVTVGFDSRESRFARGACSSSARWHHFTALSTCCFGVPIVQAHLDRLLSTGSYDVVQVEFCQMAAHEFAPRNGGRTLMVLDEHNIEYDIIRRTAEATKTLGRRIYHEVNWRKLKREELTAWRCFDGVVVTSKRDEQLLKCDDPTARTAVVPNAVDLSASRLPMRQPTAAHCSSWGDD